MSQAIAFVTDSTAYLPQAMREQYPIEVVPQVVVWSNESYRDGVDIQAGEFFERLKVDPVHPTTSVASLGDIQAIYAKAAARADAVIGIHLSAKLSNTFSVAEEAVKSISGKEVHVINSQTTSMAMGFLVLAAARAAAAGRPASEVAKLVRDSIPRTGLLLTLETLKYLQRGGRIGAAQAFMGGVLDLKPILEVRDGVIQPLERVRSRKKAVSRLLDVMAERVAGKTGIRLAVIHAAAPAEGAEVLDSARTRFGSALVESLMTDVSPTVAVHTGPGTIGLTYSEGI
jgi:DegV family protein with EDD domain